MKTIRESLLLAAFAAAVSVSAQAEVKNDLTKPSGTLSATPEISSNGTYPKLGWHIAYPKHNQNPDPNPNPNPTTSAELQGLALLVTYNTNNETTKNNNGHGNNLDGVDSSNPGSGKGGPNGAADTGGVTTVNSNGTTTTTYPDDEQKASKSGSMSKTNSTPIAISAYDTITVSDNIKADVRVLGGYNKINETTYGKLWSEYRIGGSAWKSIVSGQTQNQIDPSKTYVSIAIDNGSTIDFRSQGETDKGLSPWRETGSGAANPENVVALVNGSTPPSTAFSNGLVQPYLKPYLDSQGKISIGPRDVLYLFEIVKTAD